MERIDLGVLAERTSKGFADFVRDELTYHFEEKHEIKLVTFQIETRPGKAGKIVKVTNASLKLIASTMCYRFEWSLYEREGGRVSEDNRVNRMSILDVQAFVNAVADQQKGG